MAEEIQTTEVTKNLVSNGQARYVESNQLKKLGFKFTENLDQLLMKNEKPNWGSNKNSRRSFK